MLEALHYQVSHGKGIQRDWQEFETGDISPCPEDRLEFTFQHKYDYNAKRYKDRNNFYKFLKKNIYSCKNNNYDYNNNNANKNTDENITTSFPIDI